MWMYGPSFPANRPDEMANMTPMVLANSVRMVSRPCKV